MKQSIDTQGEFLFCPHRIAHQTLIFFVKPDNEMMAPGFKKGEAKGHRKFQKTTKLPGRIFWRQSLKLEKHKNRKAFRSSKITD